MNPFALSKCQHSVFSGTIVIVDHRADRRRELALAFAHSGVHIVLHAPCIELSEEVDLMHAIVSRGGVARCMRYADPGEAIRSVIEDFAHIDMLFIATESLDGEGNDRLHAWLSAALPYLKGGHPPGIIGLVLEGAAMPDAIAGLRASIGAGTKRPIILALEGWEGGGAGCRGVNVRDAVARATVDWQKKPPDSRQ